MLLLLVLAGVLAVLAAVLGVSASKGRRRTARLAATGVSDCAELTDTTGAVVRQLGAAAVSGDAAVVGRGQPSDVSLRAPFSGRQVLWYEATVTHHFWRTSSSSDGRGGTTNSRQRKSEVVSRERSDTARLLVVDGSGSVEVSMLGADVDRPRLVHDQMQPDRVGGPSVSLGRLLLKGRSTTIGYSYTETALVPGESLYVHGTLRSTPDGRAELVADGALGLVVSTRTPQAYRRAGLRHQQLQTALAVLAGGLALVLLVLALL